MSNARWFLALPLALAATLGSARGASVRDDAGIFSAAAVRQAQAELDRVERTLRLSATVETVESLNGRTVGEVTREHADRSGTHGLYVLIAKKETKIDVMASSRYEAAFPQARRLAIQNAFIDEFKKRDFDAGLLRGVETLASEASTAKAEVGAVPARGRRAANPQGSFGMGSLVGIGLAILAVLFVFRLIGRLFSGGGAGYGAPGMMGRPGYGPGYGGGGGGGFMSSLFGGIGGAMAGNWLYDQFSGRHGGSTTDSSSYGGDAGAPDTWGGGTDVSGDWGGGGGDAGGGGGGDWGGGGGGDTGGGDW